MGRPHQTHLKLHEPRIFYPSGHWPESVTNAHVSAYFHLSFGASVISTHVRTEGLYVKTTIIYQLKRLCVPDCAYMENMFINSIRISLYDISLAQNISYQIKRDVAVWKGIGCPPRNQRTWWQIVATAYTGLAQFIPGKTSIAHNSHANVPIVFFLAMCAISNRLIKWHNLSAVYWASACPFKTQSIYNDIDSAFKKWKCPLHCELTMDKFIMASWAIGCMSW